LDVVSGKLRHRIRAIKRDIYLKMNSEAHVLFVTILKKKHRK